MVRLKYSQVTSSGNISSSANIIGNQLIIGGGTFTSASLASGGGGGGDISYNGNRRILQTGFPTLFSEKNSVQVVQYKTF